MKVIISLILLSKLFSYITYVGCTILFARYDDDYADSYVKMKFKMVKQLYPINPDRWEYGAYGPFAGFRYDDTLILLSFIDYQKLKFYYKRQKRRKKEADRNETLRTVLETAQQDIQVAINTANKQIEEANKAMKEIGGRLNG